MTATRYLLDAPAGAVSDITPTMPRYWEWENVVGAAVEFEDDIEHRLREMVQSAGLDATLPEDWSMADLTL